MRDEVWCWLEKSLLYLFLIGGTLFSSQPNYGSLWSLEQSFYIQLVQGSKVNADEGMKVGTRSPWSFGFVSWLSQLHPLFVW